MSVQVRPPASLNCLSRWQLAEDAAACPPRPIGLASPYGYPNGYQAALTGQQEPIRKGTALWSDSSWSSDDEGTDASRKKADQESEIELCRGPSGMPLTETRDFRPDRRNGPPQETRSRRADCRAALFSSEHSQSSLCRFHDSPGFPYQVRCSSASCTRHTLVSFGLSPRPCRATGPHSLLK